MKCKLIIPRVCIDCNKNIYFIEDIGFEYQGLCNCKSCQDKFSRQFKKRFEGLK